jgi:hypothetical protein
MRRWIGLAWMEWGGRRTRRRDDEYGFCHEPLLRYRGGEMALDMYRDEVDVMKTLRIK